MSLHWTEEEQNALLAVLPDYRIKIQDQQLVHQKKITRHFAGQLHQTTPLLQQRTVEAINQRLPYLDNLLAGVFEACHYAKKDQHHYAALPRENGSKKFNSCNKRHSYNGAVKNSSN